MASTSAVSTAMVLTQANQEGGAKLRCILQATAIGPWRVMAASKSSGRLQVKASLKEKAVTRLTAAALTASMVIPDVAEAAGSGVPPSLKNFLLSIVSGGVVLVAIVGVANFDPVKRS